MSTVLKQAKVIAAANLKTMRYPIPQSWLSVAGILKGTKKINALLYQKQTRKGWVKRLTKLSRLVK